MTIRTTPSNNRPGAEPIDHTEHIFRLLGVLHTIKANPERWNQRVWIDTSSRYPTSSKPITANECGTAFCFAGWAVVQSGFEFISDHYVRPIGSDLTVTGDSDTARSTAIRLLGITEADASYLFDENRSLDEIEEAVFTLVMRHTAEMNPDPKLRYDEDGRVYVGYYVEPFAFIWDGSSRMVQVSAGGMGEPITDTFELPYNTMAHYVFKEACDTYRDTKATEERQRQAREEAGYTVADSSDAPSFDDLAF